MAARRVRLTAAEGYSPRIIPSEEGHWCLGGNAMLAKDLENLVARD